MSRTPRALRRLAVVAAALSVASATACGSDGTDSDVSAGDPSYAYHVIADAREADADELVPRTLVEALPNREVVVKTEDGGDLKGRFSDLVVAGRITKVTPEAGIFYPDVDPTATGDPVAAAKVVGFDNPDAKERIALVTLQVDWSAGAKVGQTLELRMQVPAGADANKFLAGVMGVGDAVVLLKKFEDGPYKGDYYPILSSAGLGRVAADGTLTFEGFGDEASHFTSDIATLDELETEASKPDTTLRY